MSWLEQLASKGQKSLAGTRFAVFGLGNSDWVSTYHRIPRLIDKTLEKLGAERIIDAGFANVKLDLVGPWEAWSKQLCLSLSGMTKPGHADMVGVEVFIERNKLKTLPRILRGEQVNVGVVVANRELADDSVGAAKRHIEVRLPTESEYKSGDYLAVQGRNSDEAVFRVMKIFDLSAEDVMSVQSTKKDFLPAQPMAVEHFLRSNVKLATPISKRQLASLALWTEEDSPGRSLLERMHDDANYQQLLDKRYSIIDVLEEVPGLRVPFGVYIDFLLPLAPRVYSISSSPLDPTSKSKDGLIASVTIDVFEAPARSGHGRFHGVASSYLANCEPGDFVSCLIRPGNTNFCLPCDTSVPIIMVAAGTGIAPMRAFVQERAAIKRSGERQLGPALLIFGCRHTDKDYIYRSEFEAWEKEGLVEIINCFSKPGIGQKGRHVPDALWEQCERLWEMYNVGAKIYTCGSAAKLGKTCAETWRRIWREKTGKNELESHEWFEKLKNERYVSDVY